MCVILHSIHSVSITVTDTDTLLLRGIIKCAFTDTETLPLPPTAEDLSTKSHLLPDELHNNNIQYLYSAL